MNRSRRGQDCVSMHTVIVVPFLINEIPGGKNLIKQYHNNKYFLIVDGYAKNYAESDCSCLKKGI